MYTLLLVYSGGCYHHGITMWGCTCQHRHCAVQALRTASSIGLSVTHTFLHAVEITTWHVPTIGIGLRHSVKCMGIDANLVIRYTGLERVNLSESDWENFMRVNLGGIQARIANHEGLVDKVKDAAVIWGSTAVDTAILERTSDAPLIPTEDTQFVFKPWVLHRFSKDEGFIQQAQIIRWVGDF